MIDIFMKFLGISDYVIVSDVISDALPALICVAAALTLYILIVFFQFIIKILGKK